MFDALTDRLAGAMKRLRGAGVLKPEEVAGALREVRLALLEADVNFKVVKAFVERVQQQAVGQATAGRLTAAQQVVKLVHDELTALLGGNAGGLRYSADLTVILLSGLQGSGKTTTAAKLATLVRSEGHRPLLVSLDLRRAAAVEQLRQLAAQQRVEFFSYEGEVTEIAAAALERARQEGLDVVILDTAGRLNVEADLLAELSRLDARVHPVESLLVVDALTGQEAVHVGEAFAAAIPLTGVILTKLDSDPRGGAALSLREATGQAIRFAGVGEKAGDLEVFHADRMASRILGMGDVMTLIEKAQRTIDRDEAKAVERNLRAGHLTFDDMLAQIRQVRAMGSVGGFLDLLPRLPGMKAEGGDEADRGIRTVEAVILSMTRQERARPEILDGSRRRRIAAGSGVAVADVNRVVKAREQMQQLAKQLGLGPLGKKGHGRLAAGQGGIERLFGG